MPGKIQDPHKGVKPAATSEARMAYGSDRLMEPLSAANPAESTRKKNFRLRQSVIDRAKAVLGSATETEAIEQALELVVLRHELVSGVAAMGGESLANVFDER